MPLFLLKCKVLGVRNETNSLMCHQCLPNSAYIFKLNPPWKKPYEIAIIIVGISERNNWGTVRLNNSMAMWPKSEYGFENQADGPQSACFSCLQAASRPVHNFLLFIAFHPFHWPCPCSCPPVSLSEWVHSFWPPLCLQSLLLHLKPVNIPDPQFFSWGFFCSTIMT